ncbi:MAG: hypothetical protein F6K48_24720 [Okeania sp. SIO3H1]|uniref:hypothetical protein n=1 Tax=Okeania sp. SIO1I7 TaxID=2607772 RepID=UPI0013C712DB|nr:hypothetical protein [Okeania sp. SIO1I7]NEN91936.1 hypothetical protein [Okeania sp. SIO3H1]NET30215.1 hypothetical protein [Okeania sp. SIO1I7]
MSIPLNQPFSEKTNKSRLAFFKLLGFGLYDTKNKQSVQLVHHDSFARFVGAIATTKKSLNLQLIQIPKPHPTRT